MITYVLRRALTMAIVVVLVSIIAFMITFVLPGDPALAMLGEDGVADEAQYQALREELGLDRPLPVQYVDWAASALTGDLGTSLRTGEPIGAGILSRAAPTIQLTIFSLVIAIIVGVPLGVMSAVRHRTWFDSTGTLLSLFGVALPNFWLGILLIILFSVVLGWLPPSGYVAFWVDPIESMRLMLMPAVALATGIVAIVARQVRAGLLEVLGEDYVITARSKGLSPRTVLYKHALRNALLPLVTVLGLQIGTIFSGAATLEVVFSIPGMGRLAVDSIFYRDFPMVQAVMLVMAATVILTSFVTDILYSILDPRVRVDST